MMSTSETDQAKDVADFEDLILFCSCHFSRTTDKDKNKRITTKQGREEFY